MFRARNLIPEGQSLFTTFLDYAREKNRDGIEQLVNAGLLIDMIGHAGQTAAFELAKEGNVEAVNLLVDEFGACSAKAAAGYAAGGHEEIVSNLLSQNSNPEFIVGLITVLSSAGKKTQVMSLLSEASDEYKNQMNLLAIFGFAIRGDSRSVEEMRTRLDAAEQDDGRRFAIYGYARGGFRHQMQALNPGIEENDMLIQMYAMGGHEQDVQALLGENPELAVDLVRVYARNGLHEHVQQLVQNPDIELSKAIKLNSLYGYAQGGHVTEVNEQLNENDANALPTIARGYLQGGHLHSKTTLFLLAFINNNELRETILEEIASDSDFNDSTGMKRILSKRTEYVKAAAAINLYMKNRAIVNCCVRENFH